LPEVFHPLEACFLQRLAIFTERFFYVVEAPAKFRVGAAQRVFRIGLDVTSDIDEGEDQVAQFV